MNPVPSKYSYISDLLFNYKLHNNFMMIQLSIGIEEGAG